MYFPSSQDFFECQGFQGFERRTYNITNFYFLDENSDNVLVYYHGNAGSVCDRSILAEYFFGLNHSIIFVEYFGYGNSDSSPSKEGILSNVEDINNFILSNNFSSVTAIGSSLGSGAASYQSFVGHVDNLILINPFDSILNVASKRYFFYPVRFILTENFDNVFWLEDFSGRVSIFHSELDRVVSPYHSENLYNSLSAENKSYLLIKGASHNTIWNSNVFISEIRSAVSG